MRAFSVVCMGIVTVVACGEADRTALGRSATPAELARRSAPRFDDNTAGVLSATVVVRYLADWARARPAGVTGDLIVLQRHPADGAAPFIAAAPGVRVYHADDMPLLLQVRSNGLAAVGLSPGRGTRVDAYLRRYRIDPRRDFVLLAAGVRAPDAAADTARAWLTLRYWGVAHEHLGVLDGTVAEVIPTGLRAGAPPAPPIDGTVRVPMLGRMNFSLLAELSAVKRAAREGAPIVDVRSRDEYDGRAISASPVEDTCLAGPPACTAAFAGRIQGAVHVNAATFADLDAVRFAPPDAVHTALRAAGLDAGRTHIVYDADGRASAVAAFVLTAVAGVPARWYAASFVEWGSLNAGHPDPNVRSLPADSPWRTDGAAAGDPLPAVWADARTAARPLILDPTVPTADRIERDDRAYLADPPPLPAPGSGDAGCVRE